MIKHTIILFACLLYFPSTIANEDQNSDPLINSYKPKSYKPSKVVYDLSSPNPAQLQNLLDRVSMLQNIYQNNSFESSIVVVVHEGAIPIFSKNNPDNKYRNISSMKIVRELMTRAHGLALGEIIQFRICQASAKMQGLKHGDLEDFIIMVPMADAEIVMLQNQGFAYLHI